MVDIARKVKDQLAAVQKAMDLARSGIASIRTMIDDLQRERERVRSAPVPPDEATAAIDEMLHRWRLTGQERAPGLDVIVAAAATGACPQLVDPFALNAPTVLRLMMLLLGGQARETLISRLEEHYRGVEVGLPAAERQKRLAEIDRELGKLEAAEEAAIAAAEEGGLMLDRRPDASVGAILGIGQ